MICLKIYKNKVKSLIYTENKYPVMRLKIIGGEL